MVAELSTWFLRAADEIDQALAPERDRIFAALNEINARRLSGDQHAFYVQQLLLSQIYKLHMSLVEGPNAEGSAIFHEVTRILERATLDGEAALLDSEVATGAQQTAGGFLKWLKRTARGHRAFKHPYYAEFIRNSSTAADLRDYAIQESVVDARFDDLLAMMQVGTSGAAKLEIAGNYWDEMGNGRPEEVHTHLFNKILEVFGVSDDELEGDLTAEALLSGNLAVLFCRYRSLYPEAVGFLGMTEWFAPDRFVHVVKAWQRLGLPDVGIVYHKLHITIDSTHAAGWFHQVVTPGATSEFMRRGMTRGAMMRLNSSARYLDERLAKAKADHASDD
ncbi:MAG: iron-containing redox enzyme family protein [Actinomycetota bacterium]|nr:iron-containing redox enzyme family protein [Actinomycetota bacterium]MDQ2957881.1 iron-containing redox enzyme family protein [Actinomycetota bacterium]